MQFAAAAGRHAKFAGNAQSFVKSEEAQVLDNYFGSRNYSAFVDKTNGVSCENVARIRGEIR
jgi:hypothetical protein